MIHIVDPQTNEILDYITLDNIIDDTHKKSLESYIETYDAIVLGGDSFSYDEHLEKRNHIIIPDEDGTYQEFVLFEVDKYRDTEGRKTHFYAHATYLELKKAKVIYPTRREGLTLSQHAGWALNDTGWRVGIVESEGVRTFNIENHTNPYEFLKRIAREFEVELRFRVEHDGRRITARYVDFLERIGDWKGREVEFGRDLDSIRRVEKQDIVTALLGLGPEREDGTRIEVLVEDEEALQRWGRVDEHGNLHHLIEPYEIQSDRQEMTEEEARQYTRTALNKRINTQVTYETTILDLEEVPGLEHEKIRFGDTIRIKDTYFNPPLFLEARVYEIERSIKNKAKKDIKLGDYIEYTEEEVHAIWRQLRNQIRRRITAAQLVEYAEPKKVESSTPPPIKEGENPIWVDTSKTPHVPHVVIANEWVKISPTEAQEVGAETPQGAQEKADNAEQNAKSYTDIIKSDLEDGIQQAQTTADGKNTVFRQSSQPPTSGRKIGDVWFDTSRDNLMHVFNGQQWVEAKWGEQSIVANSITANHIKSLVGLNVNDQFIVDSQGNVKFAGRLEGASGSFTGTVNANAGHFGDNLSLVDGKLRITRPDGVVWMQNGVVHQDYTIGGYDPLQVDGVIYEGNRYNDAFVYYNKFYRSDWLSRIDGTEPGYTDIRDANKAYTINFHTYEIIHSARYIVFGVRAANNSSQPSRYRVRAYQGSKLLGSIDHDRYSGYSPLVIDLGAPTYERISIDLRIGFNRDWKNDRKDQIAFRINRIYLTDIL